MACEGFLCALYKFFIFFYGIQNDLLCVFAKMSLVVFIQVFYINRLTVFHDYMTGLDFWKMRFKDLRRIVHGNGDNRAAGFTGDLKASLMEGKKLCLIQSLVSGSLWENTDGNPGFYFFNSGKDGFQPLFDILTVKKQTVKIFHPGG